MRTFLATAAASVLLAALASPTFAALPKHRSQISHQTPIYGDASRGAYYAPNSSVVTFGNRVIGQDPDPNIRSQMLRDPFPGNY